MVEIDHPIWANRGDIEKAHFLLIPPSIWGWLSSKERTEVLRLTVGIARWENMSNGLTIIFSPGMGQLATIEFIRSILLAMGRDFVLARGAYLPLTKGFHVYSGILHIVWFERPYVE